MPMLFVDQHCVSTNTNKICFSTNRFLISNCHAGLINIIVAASIQCNKRINITVLIKYSSDNDHTKIFTL